MKPILALLFLFVLSGVEAQTRKPLRGKITADSQIRDVYIVNHNSNDAAQVQERGYFTIAAAVGDTLLFSSLRFKGRNYIVKDRDFDGDLLLIAMESMIQLDEVVVENRSDINAVSLGIIPANQKKFTPAERRLAAADGSRNVYGLNNQISFDGVLNGISGRTAMLRKEVEIEKKEMFMKLIDSLFDEDYFTSQLKIPAIYVKGFLYYIVEIDSFTRILPEKNKTAISFLMVQLAEKYKESIALEKK